MTNPVDPISFTDWSDETTCGKFTPHTKSWFETSRNNLHTQKDDVEFIAELPSHLVKIAAEYEMEYECKLFAFDRKPVVDWKKKSYDSFITKLYRRNCLDNENFPDPPKDGWIDLERSFETVDDIVRTTVVVAYADAPDYVGEKLAQAARNSGLTCYSRDHAKEKGYYAYHLYVKVAVPVATTLAASSYTNRLVPLEIQITTELQGALREITHLLYEKERLKRVDDDWKRQFSSDRFRAAYMAHSLRFIEAMIVDLREKVGRGGSL